MKSLLPKLLAASAAALVLATSFNAGAAGTSESGATAGNIFAPRDQDSKGPWPGPHGPHEPIIGD